MADEVVVRDEDVPEDTPELPAPRNPYEGLGSTPVPQKVQDILDEPPKEEEVQVAEDGTVYLPHEVYRDRLFRAFGSMGWGLVPLAEKVEGNRFIFKGRLICAGRVVAEDVGEAEYFPNNRNASRADSYKAAKSNCLKACCKDLMSGLMCLWNKQWREAWQDKWCVKVWRKPREGKKQRPSWRRKDTKPFFDEQGPVNDRRQTGSGAGGEQELRQALDMAPREDDPVAAEARRARREELYAIPLELDLEALKELIGLCDTHQDLEETRLTDMLGQQKKEDKEVLGRLYAERRHIIEHGGLPPGGEQ